ncbi:MAG TPA: hypothetical protein VK645_02515 [Chitinophagaceae bacterium]|nr:hypothetical protein [Chitinophagaceae bacterium]
MFKNYIASTGRNAFNLFLVFLLPLFLLPFLTHAQLPGQKDSIYSETLKEGRVLQVQLPKEYKAGTTDKYPVLYLTDGEWNAGLMAEYKHGRDSGVLTHRSSWWVLSIPT